MGLSSLSKKSLAMSAARFARVLDASPARERTTPDYLAEIPVRVAVLHGQFSAIVTPDVIDHMDALLGRAAPFVEIPQAHHHLIIDQPLAFIAAVRALLAEWSQSLPRRGRSRAGA